MLTPAAIYARVSSDRQKEEKTIASQTAALKSYAEESGLEIPDGWVFEDEGYSGASLIRPALERLRDLVAYGQVPTVLCYAPDRLARKYAYQVLLVEEFVSAGAELRFVRGGKSETPEDELLLQFQGMIAEYERAQIAERCRRGRLHRAREGSVSVMTDAPYGYRYVKKSNEGDARYEVVEHEALVVREIFHRYVEERCSITALAKWLTERGVPTSQGKSVWCSSSVWGMLRNPTYSGHAAFGKTVRTESKTKSDRRVRLGLASPQRRPTRPAPRENWIEIAVPPIVSEETFAIANHRLEENKRFSARRTKVPSLLQNLMVCEDCGYAWHRKKGSTNKNNRTLYYYRCTGRNRDPVRGRVCENKMVRQDYLDEIVWKHVIELLSDSKLIRNELDKRLLQARSDDTVSAEKARLEHALDQAAAAMKRIVDAHQEGLLPIEEFRPRVLELRKRLSTLRRQHDELGARLVDRETFLKIAVGIDSFLEKLKTSAATTSIQERQNIVRLLVKQVTVGRRRVVIRHRIEGMQSHAPPTWSLHPRRRDVPPEHDVPRLGVRAVRLTNGLRGAGLAVSHLHPHSEAVTTLHS